MSTNALYLAGRRIEIPSSQTVALTKQINEIATVNQKANLSNTFKVAHIGENQRNLSFVGQPGNTSKYPYRFLPARYIQNGIEIVRNGNAVIVSSSEKYTNVTLYWGNSDFFDRLNFMLSELDTSDIDHDFTLINARDLHTTTNGKAFYPFIALNNNNLIIDFGSLTLNIEKTPPAVTFDYLLQKIAEKIGFDFIGDILQNEKYKNFSLQLTERRPIIPNLQQRFIRAGFIESGPTPAFFSFVPTVDNDDSFATATRYTNKTGVRARFQFAVKWDSVYNIGNIPQDELVSFQVLLNGEVVFSFTPTQGWFTPRFFNFIVDMSPNEYLQLRYILGGSVDPSLFEMGTESQIETIDIQKESLEINDTFSFSANLPEITAQDFILEFAKITGTIFNVEDGRTVNLISYDYIKKTKGENKNLPGEIIPNTSEVNFNPGGYAQNNIISYAEFARENTSIATIDNKLLENTKQWLQVNFYLPELFFISGNQSLRVFMFNEDGEKQDILPPVFSKQVRQLVTPLTYTDNLSNTVTSNTGIFGTIQEIEPQGIFGNFYFPLFEILNDFKRVDISVLINEQQFNEIKNYQSYYVKEIMAFVYVEAIENFVKGKPTKLRLIKI